MFGEKCYIITVAIFAEFSSERVFEMAVAKVMNKCRYVARVLTHTVYNRSEFFFPSSLLIQFSMIYSVIKDVSKFTAQRRLARRIDI